MNTFKTVINYLIIISVIAFLLWYSLSNIEVEEGESKTDFLFNTWSNSDKLYLFLSGFLAIISHFIRGLRWRLLLNSMGYKAKSSDAFYSVMIGYFINLVIPRGGEVSRCYNMSKLSNVPTDVSLGSVIAERLIDLFFLIAFIGTAFLIEWDNLIYFLGTLNIQNSFNSDNLIKPILILTTFSIVSIIAIRFFFKSENEKVKALRVKIKNLIEGIKKGFLSVIKLKEKNLFIVYSLSIWVLYYAMTLSILRAFPETLHLGLTAAVSIFAIGGIAMAIPLPGGAGSYHTLVPLGLVLLYDLEKTKAIAFTFIYHGWQTVVIIVFGALSLLISQYKIQKRKNEND